MSDLQGMEAFLRRPEALEPEGKFHTYDYDAGRKGETRELSWTENLASQFIETRVVIRYPRGNTRGGAVPRVYLEVKVDGVHFTPSTVASRATQAQAFSTSGGLKLAA